MVEPQKPFACNIPDCGMTFTNEDHLTVHTKKHDMYLQLGLEQKAAFVADQTPTPTRFIRNCEEVGLFQDLQNVNPFEEGFKRAMETCKHGLLTLENSIATTDELHTPQMVFPTLDSADATLYSSSNNHKNITISRSSSDELGTTKEYERTTISKLTNEITTISRVVNKHDVDKGHTVNTAAKNDEQMTTTDVHNETSVSYTNNVIKIHNNIEIRKDNLVNVETIKNPPIQIMSYTDSVIKDTSSIINKDVLLSNDGKVDTEDKLPPIMSQKSLDLVVDSLTSDICGDETKKSTPRIRNRRIVKATPKSETNKTVYNDKCNINDNYNINNNVKKDDGYEVIIKLPNGKQVKMKSVEEIAAENTGIEQNTKDKLKLAINNKVSQRNSVLQSTYPTISTAVHNILPIASGTFIPITIVNPAPGLVPKIPIAPLNPSAPPKQEIKKTVKRKLVTKNINIDSLNSTDDNIELNQMDKEGDDCIIIDTKKERNLDSRVAASRRYRVRLRETMRKQVNEIKQLKELNQKLVAEKAVLKLLITEHMKKCSNADDLRATKERLSGAAINI